MREASCVGEVRYCQSQRGRCDAGFRSTMPYPPLTRYHRKPTPCRYSMTEQRRESVLSAAASRRRERGRKQPCSSCCRPPPRRDRKPLSEEAARDRGASPGLASAALEARSTEPRGDRDGLGVKPGRAPHGDAVEIQEQPRPAPRLGLTYQPRKCLPLAS